MSLQGACLAKTPEWAKKRKATRGRKRQGILYERKVHSYLQDIYKEVYFPSPWICYIEHGALHYCQPDGLIFDLRAGECTVVEVKYSHTLNAWDQLELLYVPVIKHLLPDWQLSTLEIVKWYDPRVIPPNGVKLCKEPRGILGAFGVHIYNP